MAAQKSSWLMRLMREIHQEVNYSVPLYCDNLSTIQLAENLVFYSRTKYMEVHYHFIRESAKWRESNQDKGTSARYVYKKFSLFKGHRVS